jgi:hypothetical protein
MTNPKRQQLEQKLIEKAMKDDAFRKLLLENPAIAIETETGWEIPETIHVKVLEEDPQTVYLILPPAQEVNEQNELSNEEIASVYGGGTSYVVTCRLRPNQPVEC